MEKISDYSKEDLIFLQKLKIFYKLPLNLEEKTPSKEFDSYKNIQLLQNLSASKHTFLNYIQKKEEKYELFFSILKSFLIIFKYSIIKFNLFSDILNETNLLFPQLTLKTEEQTNNFFNTLVQIETESLLEAMKNIMKDERKAQIEYLKSEIKKSILLKIF